MKASIPHIIGHQLCPYVQRVVILAKEKQITYKITNIELHSKPHWMEKISPTGKVPILIVNQELYIFESNVICEYLDEISNDSIHPDDPLKKAIHRAWIEFGTEILNLIAQLIYRDKTLESVKSTMNNISNRLSIIKTELSSGKYFSGECFCMLDAVYATVFRYFAVLQQLTNIALVPTLTKMHKWQENLLNRDSVRQAVPDNYQQLLIKFIREKDSYIAQCS